MESIYTTEPNQRLFLYTYDTQLYLRTMQGERVARPLLLCNNYQSGLSSTQYNGTLCYTYLNQDGSLLVRSLTEPSVLFRLDGASTVSYETPHLIVFAEQLLLLYIERTQDSYSLKIHALFSEAQPDVLPHCFIELPELFLLSSATHLFVLLSVHNSSKLLRYDTNLRAEPLCTKEEFLCELAPRLEQERTHFRQKLEADVLLLEQQNKLLQEKEQHTSLLLERAKTQYAELMDVATKYRDEAIKWRSKFLGKH